MKHDRTKPSDLPLTALSTSELLELLEEGTEGTWAYVPSQDLVSWSPRLRALLGRDASAETFPNVLAITHPDDRARHEASVQALLRDGGQYRVEVRLLCADGSEAPCSVRGVLLPATQDAPERMVGFVLEEGARARARAELERSELRFRAFMDNCPAAVFIKDHTGRHVYANEAAATIARRRPEEVIGRRTDEVFPPELAERLMGDDRRVREGGLPISRRFETRDADGAVRHVVDYKFPAPPLGDDSEPLLGGFGVDVTEAVKREQQLREYDRVLQERARLDSIGLLAGGVAHDFNNVLQSVRGAVELALSTVDAREREELLRRALDRTDHASTLCERLLTYAGRGRVEPVQLDPAELLEQAHELYDQVGRLGLELTVDAEPDLPLVRVDELQLRQVLVNLVTNAAQASLGIPGARVRLECRACARPRPLPHFYDWTEPTDEARGFVCFAVEDRGVGMEAESARRAFEPFFTTRAGGHGLGLAAVLGIVRSHRGALALSTEAGGGTRVEVTLPATDTSAEAAEPSPSVPLDLEGRRILLVDDEGSVARTTTLLLERLGALVDGHEDPRAALAHVAAMTPEECPDVALLDFNMPEMTGLELAAELERHCPGLPIVITSGSMVGGDGSVAGGDGSLHTRYGFLQKPYSLGRLRAALGALLDAPRS